MAQIFCGPEEKQADGSLLLTGEQFHHVIQVLRMRAGDDISVFFTGDESEYRYTIEKVSLEAALLRLLCISEAQSELPCAVTVYQGMPKADKLETVIQKSVELGAARIVPVICKRSVVRLDEKRSAAKLTRWRKIAEAAAEQSHRALIPEVCAPVSFTEAIREAASAQVKLFPWERAAENGQDMVQTRRVIEAIKPGQSVALFIGPEGGFTEEEAAMAKEAGFSVITLGRRILRTETAAMTVLSWLVLELE